MTIPEITFILFGCTILVLLIWGLIRGTKLIKWLCVFLLIFLGGSLVPAPKNKAVAIRGYCMNNLHQIGLAIEQYRVEHGGTNPPNLQALTVICNNPNPFVCIGSETPPGNLMQVDRWSSYAYHPQAGSNDVLMYCPLKNHGDKGGNILFGDCSVKWFNKSHFEALLMPGKREASTKSQTVQ